MPGLDKNRPLLFSVSLWYSMARDHLPRCLRHEAICEIPSNIQQFTTCFFPLHCSFPHTPGKHLGQSKSLYSSMAGIILSLCHAIPQLMQAWLRLSFQPQSKCHEIKTGNSIRCRLRDLAFSPCPSSYEIWNQPQSMSVALPTTTCASHDLHLTDLGSDSSSGVSFILGPPIMASLNIFVRLRPKISLAILLASRNRAVSDFPPL